MELLLPSLALLLFAVAIAYFVMPQMAVPTLITAAIILLLAAEYFHWNQFGSSEYQRSTWQYNLRKYGSYVVIGAILLGAYGFYAVNSGAGGSMMSSVSSPALPAISAPTMGGGLASVANTAASRIRDLMRKGRLDL
jgi:hypothetical protein